MGNFTEIILHDLLIRNRWARSLWTELCIVLYRRSTVTHRHVSRSRGGAVNCDRLGRKLKRLNTVFDRGSNPSFAAELYVLLASRQ